MVPVLLLRVGGSRPGRQRRRRLRVETLGGPQCHRRRHGVIPVMEKDHIGWCKMYSETERRHFERWRMTLKLIDEEIVLRGGNAERCCATRA